MAQGRPMSLRKQKRPSTSREEATSRRCKLAKLASETEAAIADLILTHRNLAERLQELTRIEKALQRPFVKEIILLREQRTAARLQSLPRVRTILLMSAMQLLRWDWNGMPEREVLHFIGFLSKQRAKFRTLKSRVRRVQNSQKKTDSYFYLEYHALADTGSARHTPNCEADENVMAWWKKTGERMGVYFDDRNLPAMPVRRSAELSG